MAAAPGYSRATRYPRRASFLIAAVRFRAPMDTMNAIVMHGHGGRDVLVPEKIPKPVPGPGEVLVAIHAASVNHLDVHTRRGIPGIQLAMPHVPGSDAAGVVAEVGAGVAGWAPGERVVVNPMLWDGTCEFCLAGEPCMCVRVRLLGEHVPGTYCEYRAVPARNLVRLPAQVPYETAAAACLTYQTAWRMAKRAGVKAGDSVLVFGASGGVGSACVDIARHLGAKVIATAAGEAKGARARALGAAEVLDYAKEDVAKRVRELTGKRGVDVVLDQVGADTYSAGIRSLRRGGTYVTCGATTGNAPPAHLHYVFWNHLNVLGSTMANPAETEGVMRLVFEGKLKPAIDSVLPLAQAREAHRKLEERDHFGKVVLRVRE